MRSLIPRLITIFMLFMFGSVVSFSQTILSDDFEANNVGDQPAGWTISNAGGGVSVVGDPVAEGVRALRMQGSLGNTAYIYQSPSVSSDFSLEFYVMLPDTGQPNEELGSIELLNYLVKFGLGSSTSQGFIYKTSPDDGISVTTNQYHHVRIEADYEGYLYRVIVDGADTVKYSISSRFGSLEIRANSRSTILHSGLLYLDSIVVASGTFDLTPAPPSLTGPSNGSTGLGASDIYFYWSSMTSITSYQIQIGTDSTFASGIIVDQDNGTSTYRYVGIPPLSPSTTYYWRVRAVNANGNGEWSLVRMFRTIEPPPAPTTLYEPDPEEVVNDPVEVYFSYSFVSGNQGYEISVATDSAFTSVVYTSGTISGTTFYLPLSGNLNFNTRYWWRIRTLGAAGWGPYSPVQSFYTLSAPVVVQSSPIDMSTVTSDNPLFSYSAVTTSADTFYIQIVSDTNDVAGSTVVDTARTFTNFNVSITRFTPGGTYYWRTRGSNAAGTGPWSGWWAFMIHTPPNPPVHYTPNDGVTISGTTPYIDWSTVSTPYNLQIATDSAFTNVVVDVVVPSSSSYTIPSGTPLAIGTTYFWRVRAQNNVGWGPFSTLWSFTTPGIPPPPVLTSPAPGTTDLFGSVLFAWNSSPGKDTTHIQITTDTSTVSRVISIPVGKGKTAANIWNYYTAYYYNELLINVVLFGLNQPFWVRLRDHNQLGWGAFGPWILLHTLRPPTAPTVRYPANSATRTRFSALRMTTNIENSTDISTVYQNISVYRDAALTQPVIHNAQMTRSSIYLNNPEFYLYLDLAINTLYYWYVTTYNAAGIVNSSTYSFRTANPIPGIHCTGDVPGDQGGYCELEINASGTDFGNCSSGGESYGDGNCVGHYLIWRLWRPWEIPIWHAKAIKEAFDELPEDQKLATKVADVDTTYVWEPLWGFSGLGLPRYLVTLKTQRDSAANRQYWERYILTAHTGAGTFFCSNIDSGYSVDNLAPAAPSGTVAGLDNGSVRIVWNANTEKDFKEYVVYRSADPGANVKDLTPIGTVTAAEFVDATPPSGTVAYFIVARDKNNNDSPPTVVSVVTKVVALDGVPTEFSLGQNYPNPFNPTTTIRFGLPEESSVTIQVINTLGQIVDEITNDVLPAGYFQTQWRANVPSGLYIYRIVATPVSAPENKFVSIRKMVLLR